MAKTLFKCWHQKIKLALVLTFLINLSVFAQDKYTLSGVVMMEALAQPASGVSVIIKGTDTGTVTDFDGNYTIEARNGDILEFVYLGFKTETVIVSGQTTANVSLKDDTEKLDEIVVVGYGTQKKKTVTGSISKVSGTKLQQASVARVDEALVGRVSGVQIAATNTEAGGDTEIKIRGVGSISGSSDPLIVVDGIPLGTDNDILGTIDTNNIKSIDILKDAASTAIYGSRGANGVIMVTLKEGTEGPTQYSYNTYFGVKWAEKNDDYITTLDEHRSYLNSVRDSYTASGDLSLIETSLQVGFQELEASQAVVDINGGETDWEDVIIPGGTITSHAFSASGGTKKTKFNASLGYLHDEGIFIEDDFKKYNARLKLDNKSENGKFKTGGSISVTHTDQDKLSGSLHDLLRQPTWLPLYVTEGNLPYVNKLGDSESEVDFSQIEVGDYTMALMFDRVFDGEGYDIVRDANGNPQTNIAITSDDGLYDDSGLQINTTKGSSPLALALEQSRVKKQTSFRSNAFVEFKLAKGLKFKQNIIGESRVTNNKTYRGFFHDEERQFDTERNEQTQTRLRFGSQSILTYKRDIKKHSINAVGGFDYDQWQYKRTEINSNGYVDDATDVILPGNESTAFTLEGEDLLVSLYGRLTYDFDDKYLFSVTGRTDGSSRFGQNTKFGFFPAASVGWTISEENFLKNSDFITNLKLRASYGVSGSNSINRDVFQSLYRYQPTYTGITYSGESGVKATTVANPDLGWERLQEFNYGVDLEFGNGAFGIAADYYEKTSDDLILERNIGSAYGIATALQNIGEVMNTGYELELRSRLFNNPNFSWNVSAIASTNENEVTDLGGGVTEFISSISNAKRPTEFITQVGGPISAFYGYVYDSELALEYLNSPFQRAGSASQKVYVKDLNGDGLIDSDDRAVLGDPYPDVIWSFSNNFNFYDFDLSFMFQGSHGAQIRVADLEYIRHEEASVNEAIETVPNADGLIRRMFTSDHIQDASFIALRNVNFGYTLPSSASEKMKLEKVRFYVSGDNLLYLMADDYVGYNPESTSTTSDNANTPVTAGYQRGSTPVAKTVSLGLNVQF